MLIEFGVWTITKILLRATKKFSKQFIKEKFKLSDKQIELLYESVDNPEKLGDFASTLIGKEEKINEVQKTIAEIKTEELKEESEINESKPLDIVFNKIDIYSDILQEIFYIQSIRKEPIVLEGFFNSDKVVSIFDFSTHANFKVQKTEEYISFATFQDIYIEPYENDQERKTRVQELREQIKYSKYKFSAYSKNKNGNFGISTIYENYIEPKDYNLRNDKEIEPFFYIQSNYSGILMMKHSLKEYIKEVLEDIDRVKKLNDE
jgi:hypothetical protein